MIKDYDDLSFYEKQIHDTIYNYDGVRTNQLGRELTQLYKQNPAYFIPRGWQKAINFTSRYLFIPKHDQSDKPLAMTQEEQNNCIINVTSVILHGFQAEFELGNFWEV